MLSRAEADSVVTLLPVPAEYNPHWVYFRRDDGFFRLSTGEANPVPRRQALPPAFRRVGSVYVTRHDVLMRQNSLYGPKLAGCVIEASRSVDIDTPADWQRAEELLRSRAAAWSVERGA